MAFTVLVAVLALLLLVIIFGLTYKIKGLNTALITTGIAFVVLATLFIATIYAISSVMSN
jgi:hypothetical protein